MSGAEKIDSRKGAYANFLKIGQNAFEFVFDFGQHYLDDQEETFHTRIITTPAYAKAFFRVLSDCIERHEEDFGMIPEGLGSCESADKWWTR
jgi:hypothetical protein